MLNKQFSLHLTYIKTVIRLSALYKAPLERDQYLLAGPTKVTDEEKHGHFVFLCILRSTSY